MPTDDLRPIRCESPYFEVFHDRARQIVVLRRTGVAYPTVREMELSLPRVRAVVEPLGARRVLVDMRGGPIPRNDVTFENASKTMRAELTRGFDRVAFLMATAVGALQATRLSKEEGSGAMIFRDEEEALAWLSRPGA